MQKAAQLLAVLLVSAVAWAGLALSSEFPLSFDGEYHVDRVLHLEHDLRLGQFPVRWSSEQNGGYGYPTFNFYYQFPYYTAVVLHSAGFSAARAVEVVIILSLTSGALFMALWASRVWGIWGGLLAAAVFVWNPYLLEIVYLQVAFGETVVIGLLPAALYFTLMGSENPSRRWAYTGLTALALTLCVLSHNLFGPVALGIVGLYSLTLSLLRRRRMELESAAIALSLALGLTGYFWLPGLLELRHTAPVWPLEVRFSPRTELLDFAFGPFEVIRGAVKSTYPRETLGFPVVAVLVFSGLSLMVFRRHMEQKQWYHLLFGIVLSFVFIVLMIIPLRTQVWLSVPFLERAQYGARFILPVAVLGGFLAGSLTRWPTLGSIAAAVLACVALVYGLAFAWPAATEHSDDAYFRAHWQRWLSTSDGGSPIMPRWAERGVYEPAKELVRMASGGEVLSAEKRSTNIEVRLRAQGETEARFTTLYFPGWRAYIDGQATMTQIVPGEGTIAVTVPAGEHLVALRFEDTTVRRVGEYITLLTAAGVAIGGAVMIFRSVRGVRVVRQRAQTT